MNKPILAFSLELFRGLFCDDSNMTTMWRKKTWEYLERRCHFADKLVEFTIESSHQAKAKVRSYEENNNQSEVEYHSGYLHSLVSVLEAVTTHCKYECSKLGKLSAKMSAQIFCLGSKKN